MRAGARREPAGRDDPARQRVSRRGEPASRPRAWRRAAGQHGLLAGVGWMSGAARRARSGCGPDRRRSRSPTPRSGSPSASMWTRRRRSCCGLDVKRGVIAYAVAAAIATTSIETIPTVRRVRDPHPEQSRCDEAGQHADDDGHLERGGERVRVADRLRRGRLRADGDADGPRASHTAATPAFSSATADEHAARSDRSRTATAAASCSHATATKNTPYAQYSSKCADAYAKCRIAEPTAAAAR